jgi:hypothetical protein
MRDVCVSQIKLSVGPVALTAPGRQATRPPVKSTRCSSPERHGYLPFSEQSEPVLLINHRAPLSPNWSS